MEEHGRGATVLEEDLLQSLGGPDAPISELQLAQMITALGGAPPEATPDDAATRLRAAILIARGRGLVPRVL